MFGNDPALTSINQTTRARLGGVDAGQWRAGSRVYGVSIEPQTGLASHYFQAKLPRQFDEYVWFDNTRAVTPLDTAELSGLPETYPFGV